MSVCGPVSHAVQSSRSALVQVMGVETETLRTGLFLPEVTECVAEPSFGSSSLACAGRFSRGDPNAPHFLPLWGLPGASPSQHQKYSGGTARQLMLLGHTTHAPPHKKHTAANGMGLH